MGSRAAIYVRISDDREGRGLGVARQEKDCRELATRHGMDVVSVYSDNDRSAFSGRARPEFDRLLTDCVEGVFDVVLAWHTDRLYRRPRDLQRLTDALKINGSAVLTVRSGALDLSTATGRLHAGIYAQIAQHETELKSERQRRKEEELAEAGVPRRSVRPFGFEPDGIVWRQPEARMVQEATADVLTGTSLAEIVRRWNETGVRTSRGRTWTHASVRAVLTRWRNAGLREHNLRDENRQIVESKRWPGTWEPLVSEPQLRALRALVHDPKRLTSPGPRARRHLLSFFLECGACGGQMRAADSRTRQGGKYRSYQCAGLNRKAGGSYCRMSIKYEVAEEAVRSHVAARLAMPDAALLAATAIDRDALEANHQQRAELERRRTEINAADIDDRDRLPMLARVKSDLDALAAEFERLAQRGSLANLMRGFFVPTQYPTPESATGFAPDVFEFMAGVRQATESVRSRFDDLDLSIQRQIVQALVRVTVSPSEPGVQYRRDPNLSADRIHIEDLLVEQPPPN